MSEEHVRQLDLSAPARSKLNRYGILAWCMVFSVLFDPEPDDIHKSYANHFPYQPGTILFSDGEWYASYKILGNGDVQIGFVSHHSDLYQPEE